MPHLAYPENLSVYLDLGTFLWYLTIKVDLEVEAFYWFSKSAILFNASTLQRFDCRLLGVIIHCKNDSS
jgi:hypothetical protein